MSETRSPLSPLSHLSRRVGRHLRWLRRRLWWLLVFLLVAAAVVVSIGRLLAPHADQARPWLEDYLAGVLDQPVRIQRVEARWPRISPHIELRGLSIGPEAQPLIEVDRALLEARLYHLTRPARNMIALVVLGLDVALVRDEEGQWSWQLEAGARAGEGWEDSLRAGDLVLRDALVRVEVGEDWHWRWNVQVAEFGRVGSRLFAQVDASPEGDGRGEIELRLEAGLDGDGFRSVRAWAGGDRLDLAELVPAAHRPDLALPASLDAWLDWERGADARVYGHLELDPLAEPGGARTVSRIEFLGAAALGEWRLQATARNSGDGDAVVERLAIGGRSGRLGIAADRIDLAYLHGLLVPWLERRPGFPRGLTGTIEDLELGLHPDLGPYRLSGRLQDLGAEFARPALTVGGIDGRLGLSGDRAVIEVGGAPVLEWPDLLAPRIELEAWRGRILAHRHGIGFDGLEIALPILDARVDGEIHLYGEGSPVLDFQVSVPRLEPGDPRPWLPHRGLREQVRNWLEQAVTRLEHGRAELVLFGPATNWPERFHEGSMTASLEFEGLDLAYDPDWPAATDLDGEVTFLGKGMFGRVRDGQAQGVRISADRADIPHFIDAELILDLRTGTSDGADLLDLVRAMPLPGDGLANIDLQGPAAATARVRLPFRRLPDWSLEGTATLAGADFRLVGHGLGIDALEGEVPYSRWGFGPAVLDGNMGGESVTLDLQARFDPDFELEVNGNVPTVNLVPGDWLEHADPAAGWISGRSDWAFRLSREGTEEPDASLRLELASDLEGTALDLPEPLAKPADEAWPFRLDLPLDEGRSPLRARLDPGLDRGLDLVALVRPEDWRLGLVLGGGQAELPEEFQFEVAGAVERMDLQQWAAALASLDLGDEAPVGPGPDGRIQLEIGDWMALGQSMDALSMTVVRAAGGWEAQLQGRSASGRIGLIPDQGGRGLIEVEMERLYWPRLPEDPERPDEDPSDLDPRHLPALSAQVEDLRWGDLQLGRLELEVAAVEDGLDVEQLTTGHEDLQLSGIGRWVWAGQAPVTLADLELSTIDLANTLSSAGFSIALEGGDARVGLDGRWPGGPTDFAAARFEGVLWARIEGGSIPEARPGAGRLLGLVSLNTIPRRLRLDFRDVFGTGLSFDSMVGEFEISGGLARTDALDISTPSAQIQLSGTTDLVNRRYDQKLRVQPGFGHTLPIIGAIAGGPLGAAAGLALQQLFERPIRGLTEVNYRITGTWDEPVVDLEGAEALPVDEAEEGAEGDEG